MNRRQFDRLTFKEAKEITMVALEVADALFVSQGSGDVRSVKRFERAVLELRRLRRVLDARLVSDAEQENTA